MCGQLPFFQPERCSLHSSLVKELPGLGREGTHLLLQQLEFPRIDGCPSLPSVWFSFPFFKKFYLFKESLHSMWDSNSQPADRASQSCFLRC